MPACGFATQMHPGKSTHDTVAQVALCSRRYYAAKAEEKAQDMEADGAREAELAYERHLEDAGADEARLQDEMERRQGVIPFDEALADALNGMAPRMELGRANGIEVISAVVDTRPAGPNRQERRHPPIDWAAIRRIPVGLHDKGRYALRDEDGVVKFYLVSRSRKGWTSVEVMAGPELYEIPKPSQTRILARIAADPTAAAELYADEKEECSQCGTGLTHPDSLARKMGPDCAKNFQAKIGAA